MRRFLFVALLFAPVAVAQPRGFVLHNARIYTVNDGDPTASALAVRDGRIEAVGEEAQVLAAYPDWRRVDAAGHTVVPGLIDAHAHLMGLGEFLRQADLIGSQTKAEAIRRVVAFAATQPAGAWVTGRGWDQNLWDEGFPTAADLDPAIPDRPAVLSRVDGHASWLNSAGLRAAGLDPSRPAPADPEGGRIERDSEGRPAGVLVDAAEMIALRAMPAPGDAELALRLEAALAETVRHGLTGIHEPGVEDDTLDLYRRYISEGRFPIRVYAMLSPTARESFAAVCREGPHRDPRLVVRAVKIYVDGAMGSRGAALLEDYSDDPGNRGHLLTGQDSLASLVARAMECGLQVSVHAIGDRGARVVLDTYASAIRETGGGPGRHRIEHVQVLADEDFPRFAELGVIASVQPTHATSDMPWAEDRIGPHRIRGAYAWRRLRDAGARMALGSDFPVESVSPLRGFYAAITRQDVDGSPPGGWRPEERLSREEALRGFTIDAAYAGFMEDEVGSLEVGKRADFVVLSRDIMTVPVAEVLETEVLETYIDGEQVYDAAAD